MISVRFFWVLVLVLYPILGMSAETSGLSTTNAGDKCSRPLQNMKRGNWNVYERWAWDKNLCVGNNRVDFSTYQPSEHPATNGDHAAILSSEFVRFILTHHGPKGILEKYSITTLHLMHGLFPDGLDISGVKTTIEIELEEFVFLKDFSVYKGEFGGIQIINSTIFGDIHGSDMTILGDIELETVVIHGSLVLNSSKIDGDVIANSIQVSKEIDLAFSKIKGWVSIVSLSPLKRDCKIGTSHLESDKANDPSQVALNLREINLGHKMQIADCSILGHIYGWSAHIEDEFAVVRSSISGGIDLARAAINRQFRAVHSTIDKTIDLHRAQVIDQVLVLKSLVKRDIDLEEATVGRRVDIYDSEIRKNVDLTSALIGSLGFYASNDVGDQEIKSCSLGSLKLGNASIDGDFRMLGGESVRCRIDGDLVGVGAHAKGSWHIAKTNVVGNASLSNTNVGKSLTFSDSAVDGRMYASNMDVGRESGMAMMSLA